MLTAATVLRPGYGDPEPARFMLAETLARPWAAGYLGAGDPALLTAAVLTDDEQRALTLDDNGFLTAWDTRTLRALWATSAVDQQPIGLLDADPARRTVVIATADAVHVVNVETWERGSTPLPAPTDFALAPADGYVAVAAGQLLLVDPGRRPATPAPIQGIDAADRQLHIASDDLELTATGQAVPDVLELLQPLSDGRVAFGGAQFGVRLSGCIAHAEVGQICMASSGGGTTRLAVSPAEDLVGCIDGIGVELWRTRDLQPERRHGPGARRPHPARRRKLVRRRRIRRGRPDLLHASDAGTPGSGRGTDNGGRQRRHGAGGRRPVDHRRHGERHRRPVFRSAARRTARRAVDGARRDAGHRRRPGSGRRGVDPGRDRGRAALAPAVVPALRRRRGAGRAGQEETVGLLHREPVGANPSGEP